MFCGYVCILGEETMMVKDDLQETIKFHAASRFSHSTVGSALELEGDQVLEKRKSQLEKNLLLSDLVHCHKKLLIFFCYIDGIQNQLYCRCSYRRQGMYHYTELFGSHSVFTSRY